MPATAPRWQGPRVIVHPRPGREEAFADWVFPTRSEPGSARPTPRRARDSGPPSANFAALLAEGSPQEERRYDRELLEAISLFPTGEGIREPGEENTVARLQRAFEELGSTGKSLAG